MAQNPLAWGTCISQGPSRGSQDLSPLESPAPPAWWPSRPGHLKGHLSPWGSPQGLWCVLICVSILMVLPLSGCGCHFVFIVLPATYWKAFSGPSEKPTLRLLSPCHTSNIKPPSPQSEAYTAWK